MSPNFWRDPRRVWWRKMLFQVHLWTGLVLGLVLSVVGVTGSILVFKPEIERLLVPHLVHVKPEGARVPAQALVDELKRVRPAYRITNLYVFQEPDLAWSFRATHPERYRVQVYLNPYTGRIIGEDHFKDHWFDWIYRLHDRLLLGPNGLIANGIFGWMLALLSVTGVIVWWPGVSHWVKGFVYHRSAGWKGQNYDIHKLAGLVSSVLLIAVGVTGAYYAFPDSYRKFAAAVTGGPASYTAPKANPAPDGPRASIDTVLANAEKALPAGVATILFFPQNAKATYYLRKNLPGDWARTGDHQVHVDPYSGRVLAVDSPAAAPTGLRFIRAMGPVHFGTFGGPVTRVLWLLLGLAPLALFVSGVLMYWNRVLRKRLSRKKPASVEIPELTYQ